MSHSTKAKNSNDPVEDKKQSDPVMVEFTIDGKKCKGRAGLSISDAAADNGVYIPVLCHFRGVEPVVGTCRICTVKSNGRYVTACTTQVEQGCEIVNDDPDLNDLRKTIVEMLFVEGNHFCPSCEKSGSCELQALGYRYQMMVPRFPYAFPRREVNGSHPKILMDHNRCILCKRCVNAVRTSEGKRVFAYSRRGQHIEIILDKKAAEKMDDAMAQYAMDMCPVGAILKKEKGFDIPIGERKYDNKPIGSDIEEMKSSQSPSKENVNG